MPRHSGQSSRSPKLRPQYAAILRDDERAARRAKRARDIASRPHRKPTSKSV